MSAAGRPRSALPATLAAIVVAGCMPNLRVDHMVPAADHLRVRRVAAVGRITVESPWKEFGEIFRSAVEESVRRSGFFGDVVPMALAGSCELAVRLLETSANPSSIPTAAEWRLVESATGRVVAAKTLRSECLVPMYGRSMSVPEIVECSARENIAAGLSALSTEGPCGRLESIESTASPEAR